MNLREGQGRTWAYLVAAQRAEGRLPHPAALARALELHVNTVWQHLHGLERRGLLRLESGGRGSPTGLVFTTQGAAKAGLGIPLLGSIAAGSLSPATEEFEGLLALPGAPGLFALWARGDSMADYILDSDIVVVERGVEPRKREICAVEVRGETTLKYLTLGRGMAVLEPHNPEYDTRRLPASEVAVQGVFRYMVRGQSPEALLRMLGVAV